MSNAQQIFRYAKKSRSKSCRICEDFSAAERKSCKQAAFDYGGVLPVKNNVVLVGNYYAFMLERL